MLTSGLLRDLAIEWWMHVRRKTWRALPLNHQLQIGAMIGLADEIMGRQCLHLFDEERCIENADPENDDRSDIPQNGFDDVAVGLMDMLMSER